MKKSEHIFPLSYFGRSGGYRPAGSKLGDLKFMFYFYYNKITQYNDNIFPKQVLRAKTEGLRQINTDMISQLFSNFRSCTVNSTIARSNFQQLRSKRSVKIA